MAQVHLRNSKAEAFNPPQLLSGAGTIDLSTWLTLFTSTGAGNALVLPKGLYKGQLKRIVHKVDGGSGVITAGGNIVLANGVASITLANVRAWVELSWNGTAWEVVGYTDITFA